MTSSANQTKKSKQTPESAQNGLEIIRNSDQISYSGRLTFSYRGVAFLADLTSVFCEFEGPKVTIRLNLEIQLTIKISEKTEQRRFGVILAPFSS